MALLERARGRLRLEYAAAGKAGLFEQLRSFHSGDESTLAYGDAAQRLELPENTVKSHVHRLRRRYRQLVREEIAQTVSSEAEIEEEIRFLLRVVAA
jgi:RNA polymerase sigma-70 factor (ECF subfamily)